MWCNIHVVGFDFWSSKSNCFVLCSRLGQRWRHQTNGTLYFDTFYFYIQSLLSLPCLKSQTRKKMFGISKVGLISDVVSICSYPKVIYPKYSKHLPYTVAHTIDCVCSKMLNHGLSHGLFLSLFKFFFQMFIVLEMYNFVLSSKKMWKVKEITHDLNHDLTFYCTHNQLCVPQYKVNV